VGGSLDAEGQDVPHGGRVLVDRGGQDRNRRAGGDAGAADLVVQLRQHPSGRRLSPGGDESEHGATVATESTPNQAPVAVRTNPNKQLVCWYEGMWTLETGR
jgi:hypothetical protein